ncbi:Lrp/AsnC family transcriptional regulator [Nisaea denitrificans]|uniref:Lrp/AsnC family transcriptional regulator n=1 Tax=Nisaea denitrificans TaxID=390877 RepID=UPI00040520BB|nr:Lrp/AsnC family transcriptional regulator [Nisaea denitrificans]
MRKDGKLDPTNRRLLALLKEHGRTSASDLGRKLGLSRTAVQDRIRRLEKAGVILGYTAVISVADDLPTIAALVSITISERPCAPVLVHLQALPGVERLFSVAGPTDAVVLVRVADTQALSALVDRISAIEHVSTATAVVVLDEYQG